MTVATGELNELAQFWANEYLEMFDLLIGKFGLNVAEAFKLLDSVKSGRGTETFTTSDGKLLLTIGTDDAGYTIDGKDATG